MDEEEQIRHLELLTSRRKKNVKVVCPDGLIQDASIYKVYVICLN